MGCRGAGNVEALAPAVVSGSGVRVRSRLVGNVRLRDARLSAGLSQFDLARLAGVPESMISRAETGRGVRDRAAKLAIASVLGKPVWEVFAD